MVGNQNPVRNYRALLIAVAEEQGPWRIDSGEGRRLDAFTKGLALAIEAADKQGTQSLVVQEGMSSEGDAVRWPEITSAIEVALIDR